MPDYGSFERERADAVRLAEDIVRSGLKSGGEQYPNALCAVDQGEALKRAASRQPDGREKDCALALADGLVRIWTKGYGGGAVGADELARLAEGALSSMPPQWTP
jgi:hypothetical protein